MLPVQPVQLEVSTIPVTPTWVKSEEDQKVFGRAVGHGAPGSVLQFKAATIEYIAVKESTGEHLELVSKKDIDALKAELADLKQQRNASTNDEMKISLDGRITSATNILIAYQSQQGKDSLPCVPVPMKDLNRDSLPPASDAVGTNR